MHAAISRSLLSQIGTITAVTFFLLYFLANNDWQHEDKNKPKYCAYGVVVFSSALTAMTWFFAIVAGAVFVYVQIGDRARKWRLKEEERTRNLNGPMRK